VAWLSPTPLQTANNLAERRTRFLKNRLPIGLDKLIAPRTQKLNNKPSS